MGLQTLLHLAFPPQCISCGARVEDAFGLCGACWSETPFIRGLVCDLCGVPLVGDAAPDDRLICDDCTSIARPWDRGRAALAYRGNARRLVLQLKHSDRLDLVRPAAGWLAEAGACLMLPQTVVVPVPAHPLRLASRRYNQAAALAMALARYRKLPCIPDLLRRVRRTPMQDGLTREARFRNICDSIRPGRGAETRLRQRPVVLIDDVMTSGATLAAATEALRDAGAPSVNVLALARVVKDA